jgi:hypothetical protein
MGKNYREGRSVIHTASLRYFVASLVTLLFVGCSTNPASRRSQAGSNRPQLSIGSATQLLLAEAAADLHSHDAPSGARLRNFRVGHVLTPDGAKQYMLCGEFLPAQRKGKVEWTNFATIKTSGYEQWRGAQAASLCHSTVIWDNEGDLSSSLQAQLNSMR